MKPFGIVIVGCGTVGNATAVLLETQSELYAAKTGTCPVLKALVDVNFTRAREAGLNEQLFQEDLNAVLSDPDVHLVVETVGGLTTARTIIKKALKAGKHVVTANKALLAHHGADLFSLARENGVSIGFEASCAGGIPIVRVIAESLLANRTEALYGIVNGTSNFILTEMVEKDRTYAQALKAAQTAGLAEADPTLDVNGMDAAHKLTLLASVAFGEKIPLDAIPVEGIDGLDLLDVSTGTELGYVLKLVALARKTSEGLELSVGPVFMPGSHPLARVSGPFNAVSVYGSAVGHTMYYGRGAGGSPTASAVVSDILSIALGTWPVLFSALRSWPDRGASAQLADTGESVHRYYMRFMVNNESGVLNQITEILAAKNISVNALLQKESSSTGFIPMVITTHPAREKDAAAAFSAVKNLPTVNSKAVRIRIIDEQTESI